MTSSSAWLHGRGVERATRTKGRRAPVRRFAREWPQGLGDRRDRLRRVRVGMPRLVILVFRLLDEQCLLALQLACQWLVHRAIARPLRVVPETVVAVAFIIPAGEVDDRIQA